MAKWVCTVCGYVYEGEQAPEACPVCKAPASKFQKQEGELSWAAEHVVGVAKGVSEDILADLNEQAQERLDTIMEQMKAAEGVTEELKRTHQMEWVQRCNNIHNRAEEIILHEMIYS